MNYITLKKQIIKMVDFTDGSIGLFISTSDGDIKLNETEQMRAASVIKVPIVMAYLNAYEQGGLGIDKEVIVDKTVAGSGVLNYLSGPLKMSVTNLMELALIVSDNTASNMLVNILGMENINRFLKQVGAEQTIMEREFMDQEAIQSGFDNFTSSADMVMLLKLIDKENDFLSESSRSVIYKILRNQQFRQKLAAYQSLFDDDVVIANKTGELNGIEHDVAIFTKGENRVYVSVLTSGFQSNYQGQQIIAEIGKKVMEYVTTN